MNPKIKISLYIVLIVAAATFGRLFYSSYRSVTAAVEESTTNTAPAPVQSTNLDTNNIVVSNEAASAVAETNVSGSSTNASTNAEAQVTNALPERPPVTTSTSAPRKTKRGQSSMIGYFAAFLGTAVLLGLLIARDISEYFAGRGVEFMFNDEGTGIKNPEYEEAEKEWANGNHLEAIRLMREYLAKNPREQGVALRIAEIYENDLKNNLAAALEYEEVLKHKLPAERWGWAAIHLCNLYSKMGKTHEAVALLRRIVSEYGATAAAKKARERLASLDPADAELPSPSQASAPSAKPVEEDNSTPSNLPPGFRPKK